MNINVLMSERVDGNGGRDESLCIKHKFAPLMD